MGKRPSKTERLIAERDALLAAISWVRAPFVDDNTPESELRKRVKFLLEDADRAAKARGDQ